MTIWLFPDSVTTIYTNAFSSCESLVSITIPDSVTTLGRGAFIGCYSLVSITIGNGITQFSNDVFALCKNIANVYFSGTIEQWNAISKGSTWSDSFIATYVQCSDGRIDL